MVKSCTARNNVVLRADLAACKTDCHWVSAQLILLLSLHFLDDSDVNGSREHEAYGCISPPLTRPAGLFGIAGQVRENKPPDRRSNSFRALRTSLPLGFGPSPRSVWGHAALHCFTPWSVRMKRGLRLGGADTNCVACAESGSAWGHTTASA